MHDEPTTNNELLDTITGLFTDDDTELIRKAQKKNKELLDTLKEKCMELQILFTKNKADFQAVQSEKLIAKIETGLTEDPSGVSSAPADLFGKILKKLDGGTDMRCMAVILKYYPLLQPELEMLNYTFY
mgnify:CR=1 FL=1